MKQTLLTIALLLTPLLVWSEPVEIPLPARCYPLNNSGQDIVSFKHALLPSSCSATYDRFGRKNGALTTQSALLPTLSPDSIKEGLTITFWMYADTDSVTQAFFATDKDGWPILGFSKADNRAIMNMYHKDVSGKILPDRQWLWSDANFKKGPGWYFVALAYSRHGTSAYFAEPDGTLTETYSAFSPDWSLIGAWGIGATDNTQAKPLDDFKVYTTALSREQVETLYEAESILPLENNHWVNKASRATLLADNWHCFCTGRNETGLSFALQSASNGKFLTATNPMDIATEEVAGEQGNWVLYPMENITNGVPCHIANTSTGRCLTDRDNATTQQMEEHKAEQLWYWGQSPENGVKKASGSTENTTLLKEFVYYDAKAHVIQVYAEFSLKENVKTALYSESGALLALAAQTKVQSLQHSFPVNIAGVYVVSISTENVQTNKKIIVNF